MRVQGLGRDPCRTPMQWEPGSHAGFSPPGTSELWLPLAPNYEEVNVERHLDDPTSMLNLYRRLLAHRRQNPALQLGSYRPLDDVPEACFVFLRRVRDRSVLVALNFSSQEQRVALSALGDGKVSISTWLDREGPVCLDELVLRSDEGVIVDL